MDLDRDKLSYLWNKPSPEGKALVCKIDLSGAQPPLFALMQVQFQGGLEKLANLRLN